MINKAKLVAIAKRVTSDFTPKFRKGQAVLIDGGGHHHTWGVVDSVPDEPKGDYVVTLEDGEDVEVPESFLGAYAK